MKKIIFIKTAIKIHHIRKKGRLGNKIDNNPAYRLAIAIFNATCQIALFRMPTNSVNWRCCTITRNSFKNTFSVRKDGDAKCGA
jgi:hypothetical protein